MVFPSISDGWEAVFYKMLQRGGGVQSTEYVRTAVLNQINPFYLPSITNPIHTFFLLPSHPCPLENFSKKVMLYSSYI